MGAAISTSITLNWPVENIPPKVFEIVDVLLMGEEDRVYRPKRGCGEQYKQYKQYL